jgi:hypothetical protein
VLNPNNRAMKSDCPVVDLERSRFLEDFNRRDFPVTHNLAGSPLFTLPRLIEVAAATAAKRPNDVYYDAGDIDVAQRWAESPKLNEPVDVTMRRIAKSNAWIVLRQVDLDPAYSGILQSCLQEMLRLSGAQLRERMKRTEIIVFVTSPRRITTYHIDRECSFLLQVRGEKDINIFDRDDRDVLPEQELERFWTVDTNAALYKPDLQQRAHIYRLKPGNGVHIPINAPHWLRNGDDVSISVNFNFWEHDRERANLYRANYYLRQLRFAPVAPFVSPGRDFLKNPFGAAVYATRALLKRSRR